MNWADAMKDHTSELQFEMEMLKGMVGNGK